MDLPQRRRELIEHVAGRRALTRARRREGARSPMQERSHGCGVDRSEPASEEASDRAGEDVTGVIVHTPVGTDVEASVANGRYAAWWPSEQPSSKNLDVMRAWTYTVTLSDGSARHVSE